MSATGPADLRRWFPTAGRAANAPVRLVCLPALGAGIAPYSTWRRVLPGWVEVLPARLPGTEARLNEPAVPALSPLVADLRRLLDELPAKPTVLFGHCFGALLAYELARAMSSEGRPPALLWVHGQVAPAALARLPGAGTDPWERFARYADLPAAVRADSSMKRMVVPVLTAQFAILDSYAAPAGGGQLGLPVIASRGADDPMISDADLASWRQATREEAVLLSFPGGHQLDREPAAVLAEIARRIEPLRKPGPA